MVSMGPSILAQYNGPVEASKLGYNKGSLGPSITIKYNGSVESSKHGYSKGSF
jgi:hypothetical protein